MGLFPLQLFLITLLFRHLHMQYKTIFVKLLNDKTVMMNLYSYYKIPHDLRCGSLDNTDLRFFYLSHTFWACHEFLDNCEHPNPPYFVNTMSHACKM